MSSAIKTYKTGDMILRKGAPALQAYLVLQGRVRVYLEEGSRTIELAQLGPQEIFGETALLSSGEPFSASVSALEDCTLQIITPETFQALLAQADPTLQALLRMLTQRLQATNQALLKSETREFMDLDLV